MHAVLEVTLAHRMASALVPLGTYIGVAALTRLGLRTNAVRNAETVRESGPDIGVFGSLTWEAAIHSFSMVFHCAWTNGTSVGNWCCGAQVGSAESAAGCCNTTLFDNESGVFGHFFASTCESNTLATNNSASSATQSIPNSVPSNQTACSPGANSTANHNTSISKPQQQWHEPLAIDVGLGIPLAVIAFASLLLLFREHKLRLRAESTAGIINDKQFNAGKSTGRALHKGGNHNVPQELGHEPKHPNELGSREIYEVAAHGQH